MGLAFFAASSMRTFSFRFAYFAAFLKDLFHEIIPGKGPARETPVSYVLATGVICQQNAHLLL